MIKNSIKENNQLFSCVRIRRSLGNAKEFSYLFNRYVATKELQLPYHQLMAHYFNNYIPTNVDEGSPEDLSQPLYWKYQKTSDSEENDKIIGILNSKRLKTVKT